MLSMKTKNRLTIVEDITAQTRSKTNILKAIIVFKKYQDYSFKS